MFESVAAAVSPRRSHLAGPAAALAHGLVFAGLIGAALWNAAELPLPDPPERLPFLSIPLLLTPARGDGGGGLRDAPAARNRQKTVSRVSAFPTRLADEVTESTGAQLTDDQDPRFVQGDSDVVGVGGNEKAGGDCPTCPVGGGLGDKEDVVDGSVVAPILIRRVEPIYPEGLRKLHLEGLVLLEAIIATNGSVEEFRIVSSTNPLFNDAALKAVSQWRYQPCLFAGRPVRVRLTVAVTFRLN